LHFSQRGHRLQGSRQGHKIVSALRQDSLKNCRV
jgi:hypothetical protein